MAIFNGSIGKKTSRTITISDPTIYNVMPFHIIIKEGIFPEKLLVFNKVNKNGKENTRYIKPIDTQVNISLLESSSRLPLNRKNPRIIIPAPVKKSASLNPSD